MPQCQVFANSFTGGDGIAYDIYLATLDDLQTCGMNTLQKVILTPSEYIQLKADATALVSIDTVSAFIDPVEMGAAFSGGFMLILTMSLIAFKIKIAKRQIKMA